jgi:Uri superfamily endonuclease
LSREKRSNQKNQRGVYTLIIRSAQAGRIEVGGRPLVLLERGLYLYTGSALGRGSTSLEGRISRHLSRKKRNFWHIDRVLSSSSVRVVSVVFAKTTSKMECRVNTALLKEPRIGVVARGVGSSDCRCESHFLMARCTLRVLRCKVRLCYVRLGLRPRIVEDQRTVGPGDWSPGTG